MAELSASLWDKATDQKRRFWEQCVAWALGEPVPAIPEADRESIHYTLVYIDNKNGVLDVEGYVPKEAILDTGATKFMLNKTFAAAMEIKAINLARGAKFAQMPLGVIHGKVRFTFSRGTSHMFNIWLLVTVADHPRRAPGYGVYGSIIQETF